MTSPGLFLFCVGEARRAQLGFTSRSHKFRPFRSPAIGELKSPFGARAMAAIPAASAEIADATKEAQLPRVRRARALSGTY